MPHNPGPWRVARKDRRKVITEHGLMIGRATLADGRASMAWPVAEAEAHARLMAAAPDLLTLLRRWVALDGGAWDVARHAADKRELTAETCAAIAELTAEV